MPFADQVILVLKYQEIPGKQRFGIIGDDPGGEADVGSLHVAVAVVHSDQIGVVGKSFHVLLLEMKYAP